MSLTPGGPPACCELQRGCGGDEEEEEEFSPVSSPPPPPAVCPGLEARLRNRRRKHDEQHQVQKPDSGENR